VLDFDYNFDDNGAKVNWFHSTPVYLMVK